MKIRCVENSIRLRVKKSEIANLKETGQISESVSFPNGFRLKYGLTISKEIAEVHASFSNGHIDIMLPHTTAHSWMDSNEVGITQTIGLAEGDHLDLLIEKDFPCLDRPNEDKSDTFFELVPDQPDNC